MPLRAGWDEKVPMETLWRVCGKAASELRETLGTFALVRRTIAIVLSFLA